MTQQSKGFQSISQASNEHNQGMSINRSATAGQQDFKSSMDGSSINNSAMMFQKKSPFEVQNWSHKKSAINDEQLYQDGRAVKMPTVMATPYTKQLADRFSSTTGKNLNSEGVYTSRAFLTHTNADTNEDHEMANQDSGAKQSQGENYEDKENSNLHSNSDKDKRKVINKLIEQQRRGMSSSRAPHKIKISKGSGSINLLHKKLTGNGGGSSPHFN